MTTMMTTDMTTEELHGVPLLAEASEDQLRFLLENGEAVALDAGETLFQEGDKADAFHIMLSGRLEIFKQAGPERLVLAVHECGAFTGEIPLLLE